MSTRATYRFTAVKGDHVNCKTTVYIHYDGYPSGAAMYLYRALCSDEKGNLATRFVKINQHAEITESHQLHGDTEYKYDIHGSDSDGFIECYARDFDRDMWELVFAGRISSFLCEHDSMIKGYSPFRSVKMRYGSLILNAVTAKRHVERMLETLKVWQGKFEGSANWVSLTNDLNTLLSEFPELNELTTEPSSL